MRDGGLFDEIPSYQFSQPNMLLYCGWLPKLSIQANPESPAAARPGAWRFESSVAAWGALIAVTCPVRQIFDAVSINNTKDIRDRDVNRLFSFLTPSPCIDGSKSIGSSNTNG